MYKVTSKIISAILVIVMVFSIAGCNKTKDNGDKEAKITDNTKSTNKTVDSKTGDVATVKFWTHYTDSRSDYLESISDKYIEKNSKVKVEYESIPWDAYVGTKLTVAFASDTGPDIFTVSPSTIGKYVNSGVARSLNDKLTDDIIKDFSKTSLESVKYGKEYMALPYELELVGMFYDKDALSEAGLKEPKTWDDLKQVAKKLSNEDRYGIALEVEKNPYQPFTWSPFMWIAGGNVFNDDLTASKLNSDGVKKALQLWRDLIDSGAASIKPSRNTWDIGIVAEGEAVMQFATVPAVNTLKSTYPDKNIGVLPYPIVDGKSPYTVAGGWRLMVNKKGQNNSEAADFVIDSFAKDVEVPLKWCTEISGCYSPRKSVLDAGEKTYSNGMFKEFTDLLYGTEVPEIRMPAEALEIVTEMIQKAIYEKDTSIEKIADEAHEKLTKFIDSYEGQF